MELECICTFKFVFVFPPKSWILNSQGVIYLFFKVILPHSVKAIWVSLCWFYTFKTRQISQKLPGNIQLCIIMKRIEMLAFLADITYSNPDKQLQSGSFPLPVLCTLKTRQLPQKLLQQNCKKYPSL